jgi:hypothetical protein
MLRKISEGLIGVLLLLALVFKFMHYQGAGVLMMVSLGGLCLLLIDHTFSGKDSKLMSLNTAASLLGVLYILAVVFKIMHLKGAGIMLAVSMLGLSICLAVKAYCLRKSINALLPALFSITTLFILFKVMHWPKPPYVLYGSYFAFALLFSLLMLSKASKLKQSSATLSNSYMLLGGLSFILFIVEVLNKATQMEKILLLSVNKIMVINSALFLAVLYVITKTLKLETDENNRKLLKTLKGIYVFILVLMCLVSGQ